MLNIAPEFVLFALTLLGVATLHRHTLKVALIGLAAISTYKLGWGDFVGVPGWAGLKALLAHEWITLANLLGLLLGFALLADHFEKSGVPDVLPNYLPDDWKGGFCLLLVVFVMSAFLDNIAAALIGGAMAAGMYQRRLHTGFLAAIVAASNAGGSGSVVGDTTTTMMWIAGVPPSHVLGAYVAAVPALLVFGVVAARQQQAYQPIRRDSPEGAQVEWGRLGVVLVMLIAAIGANLACNLFAPHLLDHYPVIGLALWAAIFVTQFWREPHWRILPDAFRGSVFLLALVLCAAMMPVHQLPSATPTTAFGLGFVSAVFDNIPLTALALRQGGYDWGLLAFAVGFGGSMMWFGSSAGVALAGQYPQAKSVREWLRYGWHVPLGYVLGFGVVLLVLGWHPK